MFIQDFQHNPHVINLCALKHITYENTLRYIASRTKTKRRLRRSSQILLLCLFERCVYIAIVQICVLIVTYWNVLPRIDIINVFRRSWHEKKKNLTVSERETAAAAAGKKFGNAYYTCVINQNVHARAACKRLNIPFGKWSFLRYIVISADRRRVTLVGG